MDNTLHNSSVRSSVSYSGGIGGELTESIGASGCDVRPFESLLSNLQPLFTLEVLKDVVDRLSRSTQEATLPSMRQIVVHEEIS